ncbi:hypothetical protein BHE74_00000338 [Ensete ventricosum]|nr:hypothetical protein BHE74_00000338 [Ensete ventricosum]
MIESRALYVILHLALLIWKKDGMSTRLYFKSSVEVGKRKDYAKRTFITQRLSYRKSERSSLAVNFVIELEGAKENSKKAKSHWKDRKASPSYSVLRSSLRRYTLLARGCLAPPLVAFFSEVREARGKAREARGKASAATLFWLARG